MKFLSSRYLLASLVFLTTALAQAESFSIATYNVENYLVTPSGTRVVKTDAAKAKVHESILALKPDVLALQEIGNTNSLFALQSSLKAKGLDLPHWEHVAGYDTNIFVAVLSRFPIVARRSHTNEGFLLNGRRFRTSRGFAEVDIQVNPNYQFTLFTAHLKSKRAIPEADEAALREQEALILREKIDARLAANPKANIVVLGDMNDFTDSRAVRALIGKGSSALIDTRPAERNGDNLPNPVNPRYEPRNISWTHYYGKEDTYSRIDYLLLSSPMAREWNKDATYILTIPNWGLGSDHRPIIAGFEAADK